MCEEEFKDLTIVIPKRFIALHSVIILLFIIICSVRKHLFWGILIIIKLVLSIFSVKLFLSGVEVLPTSVVVKPVVVVVNRSYLQCTLTFNQR